MLELDNDTRRWIYDSLVNVLPVERVLLFGSYARGEQGPDSDIDLYAIVRQDSPGLESNCTANHALLWLLDYDMPYDVFVLDEATFDARSKMVGTLERTVEKEGVDLVS